MRIGELHFFLFFQNIKLIAWSSHGELIGPDHVALVWNE